MKSTNTAPKPFVTYTVTPRYNTAVYHAQTRAFRTLREAAIFASNVPSSLGMTPEELCGLDVDPSSITAYVYEVSDTGARKIVRMRRLQQILAAALLSSGRR